MTAAAGVALGAVAALRAVTDAGAGDPTLLRHLYFVPVVVVALRAGLAPGALAAVAAVVLDAPLVLPAIERAGLGPGPAEALVTYALLLVAGPLAGGLAGAARERRRRYETLLEVQRVLAREAPPEEALAALAECLRRRLHASDVAVAVRDDASALHAGGAAPAPGSVMAAVLADGVTRFIADTGGGPRPRRALVVPLVARGACCGALAVERVGELPPGERLALGALGAHLGLALENARLAARQRRFAEELAAEVQAVGRARASFVAIASHELRTPLTALLGFAELLARRRVAPGEVPRVAAIVWHETERLARIVDDVLDLSRIEQGIGLRLRRAPVAPGPAAASVVELLSGVARAPRIVLDCPEGLPAVDADPDALDRILKNLVGNALKYSPPASPVHVRVRAGPGCVEFGVEDTGRGIPPEVLPRVFEPYYRAPDAAGAARGAGLGLAVVKALVDAHGGTVRVESAPGAGTRVGFTLPAVP